jgi:UPF0755 protein
MKISKILIVSVLLITLFAGMSSCSKSPKSLEELGVKVGDFVKINIPEGATLSNVADILEQKGIVDSSLAFRLYVQMEGKEKNIIPGEYEIVVGSTYESVLKTLMEGPPVLTYKIMIPEGFTMKQVSQRISENTKISKAQFDYYLNPGLYDYEFLGGVSSLEGFLFPKTYEILRDATAKDFIIMMLDQFKDETSSLELASLDPFNLSFYDVIKVASLIEREAYVDEERELISAVIYNRLKKDMLLQIDASVRYGIDKWDDDLTKSDLQSTDNLYNSYVYKGLPPTPICNPGLKSILAALDPADVDYLYYVITDPVNHTHSFTNSEQEFYDFQK